MIRYRYNRQVSPPAPFVHVKLARPDKTSDTIESVAQLDTGADMTVLPADIVSQLQLVQLDAVQVRGFGGGLQTTASYLVQLCIRDLEPVVIEALVSESEPHILAGRDLLNHFRITLGGPEEFLEISSA